MNFLRIPLNKIQNLKSGISPNVIVNQTIYRSTTKWRKEMKDDADIPKNVLQKYITSHLQAEKGDPYDCKPFKMVLDKNKKYMWCSCGWGHNQPMCDNTHRIAQYNLTMKPVLFQVAETKEYWLCNCKQTNNRPFCDGSHRNPEIQEKCKNNVVATG